MNTTFLNIISSAFAFLTYLQYFRQVLDRKSVPNPATWGVWLIVGFLNSWTYTILTKNTYQAIFLWIITLWVLLIFLYSVFQKRFSKISKIEVSFFVIIVLITAYYLLSKNEVLTHLSLQVVYTLSYIPTIIGLLYRSNVEKVDAWILAFITYSISFVALIFSGEDSVIKYVHIVVNGLIGNGIIVILSLKNKIRNG